MQDSLLLEPVGYDKANHFKQSLEIEDEEFCYNEFPGLEFHTEKSNKYRHLGLPSILSVKYLIATLILVFGFLSFAAYAMHLISLIGNSLSEWTKWSISCEWGVAFLLLVFSILYFAKKIRRNSQSLNTDHYLTIFTVLALTLILLEASVTISSNL